MKKPQKKAKTELPFIIESLGSRWAIVQEVSFETKSASGLVIPGQARMNENGHRLMAISSHCVEGYQPGDMLLVSPVAGLPITLEGVQYKVVTEGDIYGKYDHKRLKVKAESTVLHKEKSGLISDEETNQYIN